MKPIQKHVGVANGQSSAHTPAGLCVQRHAPPRPVLSGTPNKGGRRPAVNAIAAAVAGILYGSSGGAVAQVAQLTEAPADTTAPSGEAALETIVVTGTTTNRTILNSSSDIIAINEEALAQKAPRSTDEVLELIPGFFVEDTAGAVSNNYSVRGLPGGGQQFVNWMEDGLMIAYPGTGNPDELFSYDINVLKAESVLGGISNVLLPNAAGASINWITRQPNFDKVESIVRVSATSYADRRVDLYYSAPLNSGLAFNVGGYLESNRGTRDASFTYSSYHLKAALEKKFDNGASVTLSAKIGDQHDPYYADMPFTLNNGKVGDLRGLNGLKDNIAGPAFGTIVIPGSCVLSCYRSFSLSKGIAAATHQIRLDLDLPLDGGWTVFAKAHLLTYNWDFNGVFPGSGSGNAGLDTANSYLNGGPGSPISGLLTKGAIAFPGATFGLKDLTNGSILSANNAAALNALNGNGLLQQTWLNHQDLSGRDFASNFGARWETGGDTIKNHLTVGGMYYRETRQNNQSSTAHVVNGVTSQSHIYDVVALNGAGNVIGSLTDHGLVSYGDWGTGINKDTVTSLSGYFNDELAFNDKLHIDFGVRVERYKDTESDGQSVAGPCPMGTFTCNGVTTGEFYGLNGQPWGSIFNGNYNVKSSSHGKAAESFGINYTLARNLAVYGQFEYGFQQNGGGDQVGSEPTGVYLYEAGVRYGSGLITGSLGVFRTELKNQNNGCFDPANPNFNCSINYDVVSSGVEYDFKAVPLYAVGINAWEMSFQGALQKPSVSSARVLEQLNGVTQSLTGYPDFNGKVVPRTPKILATIDEAYVAPGNLGRAYLRYRYQGAFYDDIGNGVKIPGYGTWGAGVVWNATQQLNLNLSVQNFTNKLGLTEGNPRQGLTQQVVNGSFYGRAIPGRNWLLSAALSF
ncbi:MAG: TonB-dependent receptor [Pseudomonadota bacterium]|nr:TonB-dependent receptor [Pseudomonadota bacterium]